MTEEETNLPKCSDTGFLLHLIYTTWNEAFEDKSAIMVVPTEEWAKEIIIKAKKTYTDEMDKPKLSSLERESKGIFNEGDQG